MAAAEWGESEHPYAPKDLKLPGYVPCFLSQKDIVFPYLGVSFLVVSLIWLVSGRSKVSKTDRLLMCWWVFTGLTHMILEGYFAFSPEFYKEKTPHFLAEVWKEYSKGDSRYAGRESGIVTVEGITAVLEGPASLLAMYAIATRKSYSYILQFSVCLGQLYGCLVYFITAFLDGDNFAAGPFYYWWYYAFANGVWVVIPSLIAIRCWKKITAATAQAEKKIKTK
ncbi:putative 3-beta-hydroxysteroid-Delta(8),Delta(7)-isomerase [Canna indica]|uniref:3-beta-hydroxysteroid-Delta(8),Delta(7)-isomerase n=1 Tax=Canna indica TaxID=4628 RepID=A0AAQ3KQB6_9LILI|nr:putative 3-beta-hydroxysteroid-Delta(8),Delta(7)-isomerase [Canna indica]